MNNVFTPKQQKILSSKARIFIAHGAKRAGKTYAIIIKFLLHVSKFKGKKYKFIIGGASLATIQANILDDMSALIGKEIKVDKFQNFELFGNIMMVRPGANSDSWKRVRGFTAYGALINEGTALNDKYIKEVISRCSGSKAIVLIDTNPENPTHTIKVDYIDKSGQVLKNGRLNIEALHFCLDDNTFLDEEYIESIKLATPKGMYYDRDIDGKWVNAEGIVYKDFSYSTMIKNEYPRNMVVRYIAGVDWGYEHPGTMVVIAITNKQEAYLIKEIKKQHEEIDFWVSEAKKIKAEFGNIPFYCDSARTEHIARFVREGILARLADKSILSGIEIVASLMKQNKFFVLSNCKEYLTEVANYVWDDKTGLPVKINDDIQDSVRYAIYTDYVAHQTNQAFKNARSVNYLDKRINY